MPWRVKKKKYYKLYKQNNLMKRSYQLLLPCAIIIVRKISIRFLFTKRYSEAYELPCITFEEFLDYENDVSQFVHPRKKQTYDLALYIHDFLNSLPEDSWRAIQNHPISMKDLPGESKNLIIDLLSETFIDSLRYGCQQVKLFCDFAEKNTLSLLTDAEGTDFLKYKIQKNEGVRDPVFYPELSKRDKKSLEDVKRKNISFLDCKTIFDITQELNSRTDSESYRVSESLKKKPVSIVGMGSASASKIMSSISLLYDLQLVTGNNTLTIARKKIKLTKEGDSGTEAISYMPYPLRRSIGKKNFVAEAKQFLFCLHSDLKKIKTKTIQAGSLLYPYKVAMTLVESATFINEVRDNDMARLRMYTENMDALSFRCDRTPGKSLSFIVIRDVNGKMISGPEYTTSNDVKRD